MRRRWARWLPRVVVNEEPLRRADFPSHLDGLVARLRATDAGGYMLTMVEGGPHDDDVVTGVLLDFVLGEPDAPSTRTDFIAPPRDFLRRVETGRLNFNDVDYALTWLSPDESAQVIAQYHLHTWTDR